ncbi:MAG: DUF4126 domain-containing protein [Chloroflexi bacterium]|nr:DUF4126 domain-containing protein [Chloroflexota bacterium]
MDPILLGTASAFGLAAAAGLNTSLPLLLLGLAARFGLLTLVTPYDALGSDIALGGLAVLAFGEFAADKIPGADSVVQVLQGPLTLGAGAILFASQNSLIQDVSPGLAILVGLLTAGGVHSVRALVRPVVNLGTFGLGGPVASVTEDIGAVVMTVLAIVAPLLAILALGVAVVGLAVIAPTAARRLLARRRGPQPA